MSTIHYRDYCIRRADPHNWVLSKIRNGVDKDGNERIFDDFKGYYNSVQSAFTGIVKDALGEGCEDLEEVIKQIDELNRTLTKVI